jgi:hypothetical protein
METSFIGKPYLSLGRPTMFGVFLLSELVHSKPKVLCLPSESKKLF